MKKLSILFILSILTVSAFSEGYFLNRLGASSDADGTEFGKDLFTIDKNDKSDMHFAEYAEFAYFWENAEVMGIFAINNSAFESPEKNIIAAGYGIFSPLSFISIAAGNDTRDAFSFSGGELYTENEAYVLQANPFADGAGLVFNQEFGDLGVLAVASIGAAKGTYLNAGALVTYETDDYFTSLQVTAQNILNKHEYYHYGIFGYFTIPGIKLNVGYISNYNDQNINDFDREEVDSQDYLPLPSTHVLKVSAQYKDDLFLLAFDGLTGLNKEYILNDESKKLRAAYDAWEKYEFIPELQGYSKEDGLLGKNKNIPWLAAVKGGMFLTDDFSVFLKYSVSRGDDYIHVIYPYAEWGFGESSLFRLGTKFKIDDDKFSVSIPIMWQYRFDLD